MSDNSSPLKGLPVWALFIATVIGVPAMAGLAFAEQVVQNPWQALGWTLLYEMLVLVLGFVTKIWQRLEDPWIDAIAGWIDAKAQQFLRNVFGKHQQRYLEHLIYRHRDFDVKEGRTRFSWLRTGYELVTKKRNQVVTE